MSAQFVTFKKVVLWAPDPLPTYGPDREPDTASFIPGWYALVESQTGVRLTTDEKLDLSRKALALYNYTSNAATTLTNSDVTIATSGNTITGGQYSLLGEIHANAENVSQERIDQGAALAGSAATLVKDGTKAVGEWVGEVVAAPLRGFANGVFNTRTILTFAGVSAVALGGLYLASTFLHPSVTVKKSRSK